jgi:hypothetical protein
MRKVQILYDQAVFLLFTMPNEDSLSDLAREYLNLCCKEEMSKLRRCLTKEKEAAASAAAEAKKLATKRAAKVEVEVATYNRVPPPP